MQVSDATQESVIKDDSLDGKIDSLISNSALGKIDSALIVQQYVLDPVTQKLVEVIEPQKKRKKKPRLLKTEDYEVLPVLQSHPIGKELLKHYESHQSFDSTATHHLVDIISLDLIRIYGE